MDEGSPSPRRSSVGPVVALVGLLSFGALGVVSAVRGWGDDPDPDLPAAEASSTATAPVEPRGDSSQAAEPEADESDEAEIEDEAPLSSAATLVWAHDQEPPDLHLHDPANGLAVTSWVRAALIEGLFGVGADLTYHPELLDGEPTLTVADDGSVRIAYTLRSGLRWSDGTPLTSADVAYSHDIIVEGCRTEGDGSVVDASDAGCVYRFGPRTGYDLITGFEVIDELRFEVTMAVFFAGWRNLYSEVYAAHAFGASAIEVNANLIEWTDADGPLPSSGPMVFDRWDRTEALYLVRNDDYHGSQSPEVDNREAALVEGVRIDFVGGVDAAADAVTTGRAHLLMAEPELSLQAVTRSAEVEVATTGGPRYEHWGLNLLNPHLAKPQVREALAYVIDKQQLSTELYQPLYGDALSPRGLGNAYWMANQPDYEDHQSTYAGANPAAAAVLLESVGYEVDDDGIYVHPIDGRLRLRVGTPGGDPFRERQQELLRDQFDGSGIEIVIDNLPGPEFFRQRLFAPAAMAAATSAGAEGNPRLWDISQFSWRGGPWPGGISGAFRSGAGTNPYGFANAAFDLKAFDCDGTVDDVGRALCYNELDRYVTTLDFDNDGLFVIPLSQRPSFYAYRSGDLAAIGPAPDVSGGGPLANVVDFRFR